MNDIKDINKDFENFHQAAAAAISACEAFIDMDINEKPREAIFVRFQEKKNDDEFRDMMPTSEEFYM